MVRPPPAGVVSGWVMPSAVIAAFSAIDLVWVPTEGGDPPDTFDDTEPDALVVAGEPFDAAVMLAVLVMVALLAAVALIVARYVSVALSPEANVMSPFC